MTSTSFSTPFVTPILQSSNSISTRTRTSPASRDTFQLPREFEEYEQVFSPLFKLDPVPNLEVASEKKKLKFLLGLTEHYSKFVSQFSTVLGPLRRFLRKGMPLLAPLKYTAPVPPAAPLAFMYPVSAPSPVPL